MGLEEKLETDIGGLDVKKQDSHRLLSHPPPFQWVHHPSTYHLMVERIFAIRYSDRETTT
jgi:hypothetical protein